MNRRRLLSATALLASVALVGCAGGQAKTSSPPAASAAPSSTTPAAAPEAPAAKKAEDLRTVESLFRDRTSLGGQTVAVRGKVVKAKSGIMGKTWIHIQDGTGGPGTNDLTVTSNAEAPAVGKKVVVRGRVSVNKDFGAGYRYELILEDAAVTAD